MTKIRKIQDQDIEPCARIFAEVFSRPPYDEKWSVDDAHRRLAYFLTTKGFVGFVIEDEGHIAGFLIGAIKPWLSWDVLVLDEFCVAPASQGKGLGGALLKHAEGEAKRMGVKEVSISAYSDVPAFSYYQKQGYEDASKVVYLTKNLGNLPEK